jgi:hypothetical protein
VAEVLAKHVTLKLQGIDRMYLNVYVNFLPQLRLLGVGSVAAGWVVFGLELSASKAFHRRTWRLDLNKWRRAQFRTIGLGRSSSGRLASLVRFKTLYSQRAASDT